MSRETWRDHIKEFSRQLHDLSCRDSGGGEIGQETCFDIWKKLTVELKLARRIVYLIGNGASASMASHMAADLAKNAQVHTEVFSDLSLITAISNDMGYENVFSEPLSRRAGKGDMLVAISSSGKSPNILKAVEKAKEIGLDVITLSAMGEDNPLRSAGDLNLYVPASTYGYAESCHAAVLHHWIDIVKEESSPY